MGLSSVIAVSASNFLVGAPLVIMTCVQPHLSTKVHNHQKPYKAILTYYDKNLLYSVACFALILRLNLKRKTAMLLWKEGYFTRILALTLRERSYTSSGEALRSERGRNFACGTQINNNPSIFCLPSISYHSSLLHHREREQPHPKQKHMTSILNRTNKIKNNKIRQAGLN